MSIFVNSLLKNASIFNPRLIIPFRNLHFTPVRNLYSPAALGVDNYLQRRKRTKEQFVSFTENFKTKMSDFTLDSKNMIFTEDLKNMVHLAEPADLDLVLNMIKKFNSQNTEFRFGSFVFGPVAMRMFHFLDAPNEALKCFYEPTNDGFFDQIVSFHILMDLLYNHEMYDEMYKVFDKVQEKQINMTKFPKYSVVLTLAACYKQNTPKSLEYASKLWTDMTTAGTAPVRRATTYIAALALRQGAPHIALESISSQKQHYVTIRNVKAMALADLGRLEDAILVLRSVLDIDNPDQKDKHTFFNETVERVRLAADKSENKDVQKEFQNVEKALKDHELIENKTLDQLLNAEISLANRKDPPRGMPSTFQQRRMPFGQRPSRRVLE